MKAITIHQPYAALIALEDGHPDAKRVENRGWYTAYRGPLLIHAGLSRARINEGDERPGYDLEGVPLAGLAFGAVVAVAELAECFRVGKVLNPVCVGLPLFGLVIPPAALARRPWLRDHRHVEGPWCFVLEDVRPLAEPVPCRGAQALWTPPPAVVAAVEARLGGEGFDTWVR